MIIVHKICVCVYFFYNSSTKNYFIFISRLGTRMSMLLFLFNRNFLNNKAKRFILNILGFVMVSPHTFVTFHSGIESWIKSTIWFVLFSNIYRGFISHLFLFTLLKKVRILFCSHNLTVVLITHRTHTKWTSNKFYVWMLSMNQF